MNINKISIFLFILILIEVSIQQECYVVPPNMFNRNKGYLGSIKECAIKVNNTVNPTIFIYGNQIITENTEVYMSIENLIITPFYDSPQSPSSINITIKSNYFLSITTTGNVIVDNMNFIGQGIASSAFILTSPSPNTDPTSIGTPSSFSYCSFTNFSSQAVTSSGVNLLFFNSNATNCVGNCGVIGAFGSIVQLNNTNFTANYGSSYSGVVCASKVIVSNSTFISNYGYLGGVIFSNFSTVYESIFQSNSASYGGGAIYSHCNGIYGTSVPCVSVLNSSFTFNNAIYGGVIFTDNSDKTQILNNMFYQNQASYGGALYFDNNYENSIVQIDFSGSSFYQNSASMDGGAIYGTGANTQYLGGDFYFNNAPSYPHSAFPKEFYNSYIQVNVSKVTNCPSRPRIYSLDSVNITCFGVTTKCSGWAIVNQNGKVTSCTDDCGCSSGSASSATYASSASSATSASSASSIYSSGSGRAYSSSSASSGSGYYSSGYSGTAYSSTAYTSSTPSPSPTTDSTGSYDSGSGTTSTTYYSSSSSSDSDSGSGSGTGSTTTSTTYYSSGTGSTTTSTTYYSSSSSSDSGSGTGSTTTSTTYYSSDSSSGTTTYSSGSSSGSTTPQPTPTPAPYTTWSSSSWSIISTGILPTNPPTISPTPNTPQPSVNPHPRPSWVAITFGVIVLVSAIAFLIYIIKHIIC